MTNEQWEQQLETLELAIASGALKVKYADKEITYNSTAEMFRARDLILKKLGRLSSIKKIEPCFSKGL